MDWLSTNINSKFHKFRSSTRIINYYYIIYEALLRKLSERKVV